MRVATKLVPLHRLLHDRFVDDLSVVSSLCGQIQSLIEYIEKSQAERIFIYSNDRYFFLSALLAALQVGVEVILPHTNAPEFLRGLLKGKDILLTETITLPNKKLNETYVFKVINPSKALIALYTSGSTGNPKKIIKTLFQIEAEIECLNNTWGMTGGRFLSMVFHHYIYGLLFSVLWPVCAQKPFFRYTITTWDEVLNVLKDGDVLVSTPSQLERFSFLENHKKIPKVDLIFSSGAPLSFEAAQQTQKYFSVLPFEVYGSTETGGIAYRKQIAEDTKWTPFLNVVVNKNSEGCLQIKSNYLADQSFYQTQDRVNLYADNTFDLLGRADRIIKIEGKRICLIEIEKRLSEHAFIKNNLVLVLDSANRDELGSVIILTEKGAEQLCLLGRYIFIKSLKDFLSKYFDQVLIPRKWRFVDELLVDGRGKCSQPSLRALFMQNCEPVESLIND